MEITRVSIFPSNDEGVAAYAAMTFDDCFVIHGLVLRTNKEGGYSLHMPQKRRANCMYVDMVAPLDNETRRLIEEKVFEAYRAFANDSVKRPVSQ